MSGYLGNSDAGSEHTLIISENGIDAARRHIQGRVLTHCLDCGEPINEQRRAFAEKHGMKCVYCIDCQQYHDTPQRVKMLTYLL